MQSRSLKSKRYSESIDSGRLHQNNDLEAGKWGKTCKRGPAWSYDVKDTQNVSCAISQATSCPSRQCFIDQIQVQKPIIVLATDQMPDHTQNGQQSHQHRQQYYRQHHQAIH